MRRKICINTLYALFIIGIFVSYSYKVNAEVKNKQICINNILYNISWDSTKNSAINENIISSLTEQDITNGYFGQNTESNSFLSSLMGTNCLVENGQIYSCPSSKEIDKYDTNLLHDKVSGDSNEYKYIKMDYNVNNDTYTVRIQDIYDGKVKVRAIPKGGATNNKGLNPATNYSDFLCKNNGYFIINNVRPTKYINGYFDRTEYVLEFYINDPTSKCNNTYIASFNLVMSMVDDTIKVPNPAKNNKAAYGCDKIESYINSLVTSGLIDKSKVSSMKSHFGYLCYVNEITVTQYKKLREDINKQYENMVYLYSSGFDSGVSNVVDSSGVVCNNGSWTAEKIVKEEHGSYWDLVCKERYYTEGEKPKLVRAGNGFKYSATFHAEKVCTLTQNPVQKVTTTVSTKNIAVMKPQCVYSCYTVCSYDEKAGRVENTTGKAGPNDDFDNCVKTCDGGKYTQKCINACYDKTYNTKRELPEVEEDSSNKKIISFLESGLQRVDNSLGTVTSTAGGTFMYSYTTSWGVNSRYAIDFPTAHCGTIGIVFSTYCEGHNGKCEVFESVGPAGCTDTPNAEYKEEITTSMTEHSEMLDIIDEEIPGGEYEIEIADSYLNNNGQAYVYKLSTKDRQNVIVSESTSGGASDCETENWLFGDQGERATSCKKSTTTKTVTVSLPLAYLNKITGNAIYEAEKNRYFHFDASTASTRLERTTLPRGVYSGGNKYYTNILSDNVNVREVGDKITLVDSNTAFGGGKAGISVKAYKFGTGHAYNSTVNCYYGVYNDTVDKPICNNPPCKEKSEGLTLIFRPIDLNDNFPNDRNPRWNWSSSNATVTNPGTTLYSLLNYKVDPVALNKNIENKGYNIYSDPAEIDYDITLTPENIANIRNYNRNVEKIIGDVNKDGSYNYLDYDMTCGSKNNREYCYSNFLDNTNYITYGDGYNSTARKDIAICNNTYNGACSDAGGTK